MDFRTHVTSALVALFALTAACEGLRDKQYPLGDEGYPHLKFKGFDASECDPAAPRARVLRVVRETLIAWDDLSSLSFRWNGDRAVSRPKGTTTRGGVFMVNGQPHPFGVLCVGNLLIDGTWEWGPKGLLLRQGSTLKHPWPTTKRRRPAHPDSIEI